jgi:carboxylesterase type B
MSTLDHPHLGPILGVRDEGLTVYRGIPFAQIPRRFARSTLQTSLEARWTLGGIFDATKAGPTSIQPFESPRLDAGEQSIPTDLIAPEEGRNQSEYDCLNLTVYVPNPKADATSEGDKPVAKLPVLVFLHGGAFIWGSGDRSFYAPKTLLAQAIEADKPLILVTANYRLGALGYLHSPSARDGDGELLLPPNNGFHDQTVLFEWVKAYIAGFGGDPANITTIGQSAGAESLSIHNLLPKYADMPEAERPYRKSILFSGSLLCMPAMDPGQHQKEFVRVAKRLGSKTTGRTTTELAHDLINQTDVSVFRDLGWHGTPCLEAEMLPYGEASLSTILGIGPRYRTRFYQSPKRWVSEQIVSSAKFDGGVTYHAVKSNKSRRQDYTRAFRQLAEKFLQPYEPVRPMSTIGEDLFDLYGIYLNTDDDDALRAINQLETDLSFILPTIYEAMGAARETEVQAPAQGLPGSAPSTKTYLQLWQLPTPFDGLLEPGKYANHTYDIVSFFGAFEDRLDITHHLVIREWRSKLIDFICLGGEALGWKPWTEDDGHATVVDLDGMRTVHRDDYMGPRTRLGRLIAVGERIDPRHGLDMLFSRVVRPYLFDS